MFVAYSGVEVFTVLLTSISIMNAYLTTLSQSHCSYSVNWKDEYEFQRTWKETAVVYFKIINYICWRN
jgi:hypothetical protein